MIQKSVSQIACSEEVPSKKAKGSCSSPIRLQKRVACKFMCLFIFNATIAFRQQLILVGSF